MNKANTINREEQNISEQLDILEKYDLVKPYLESLIDIGIYPTNIIFFANINNMISLKEDSYDYIVNFKKETDEFISRNIVIYHTFSNLKRILNDRYGKDYPEYFI